jgi:NMD protein affecting ribosome stability and mRNA decay
MSDITVEDWKKFETIAYNSPVRTCRECSRKAQGTFRAKIPVQARNKYYVQYK